MLFENCFGNTAETTIGLSAGKLSFPEMIEPLMVLKRALSLQNFSAVIDTTDKRLFCHLVSDLNVILEIPIHSECSAAELALIWFDSRMSQHMTRIVLLLAMRPITSGDSLFRIVAYLAISFSSLWNVIAIVMTDI